MPALLELKWLIWEAKPRLMTPGRPATARGSAPLFASAEQPAQLASFWFEICFLSGVNFRYRISAILSPLALHSAGEPGAPGLAGTMWLVVLPSGRACVQWAVRCRKTQKTEQNFDTAVKKYIEGGTFVMSEVVFVDNRHIYIYICIHIL